MVTVGIRMGSHASAGGMTKRRLKTVERWVIDVDFGPRPPIPPPPFGDGLRMRSEMWYREEGV